MSTKLFKNVIRGLCDMYELDPKHILSGGTIEMGGVNFCLLHDEAADSPLLMSYCDFGAIAENKEKQAYKKLLEINLSSYTGQGPTFCLSPSGHVVLVNNYLLEILTPEILAGYLALVSMDAKDWRDDFFLVEEAGTTMKKSFNTSLPQRMSKTRAEKF